MTDFLRSWIVGILGAGIICSIAMWITPQGRVKKVLKLLCGTVMLLALLRPLVELNLNAVSINLSEYKQKFYDASSSISDQNDSLNRTIIEEECRAYILDKAQVLGVECGQVTVTAKRGDDGFWYPYEVRLYTDGANEEVLSLRDAVAQDLGIPVERQHWSNENEN